MLYLIIYYYKCKLYFIFNTKTEIFFKNFFFINKIILIYKYVKLMIKQQDPEIISIIS